MNEQLKRLSEKRARLWSQASDIITQDEISAEDRQRYDALLAEIDELKGDIDRLEQHEARSREMEAPRRDPETRPEARTVEPASDDAEYRDAFWNMVRYGRGELDINELRALAEGATARGRERRAQVTATGAAGAYLVPEDFHAEIIKSMKWYASMRDTRATVITTSDGADLPIPTNNDTANVGELIADDGSTAVSEQDTTFGVKTLGAYTFSSKMIRVSLPLLQDNAFDLPAYLSDQLAERLGRTTQTYLTTGTGTNQPEGVVTTASAGTTAAAATAIAYSDLLNLEHSVDRAYRRVGEFMFHDSTLKALRALVDLDGRPIWQPGIAGIQSGAPDTLLGYRYHVNNDMATIAASAKTVLFGDFSKFWIRDVKGLTMIRLDERYAEYLHVAFFGYLRMDSILVDTAAIKVLAQAAS